MERVVQLLVDLYKIVDELESIFPGRHFTPDGHMVGSLGEAWAKWMFDLELLPGSAETHDAMSRDGRLVQVKATQGGAVALYGKPDHLVVLRLHRTGHATVEYNGPGGPAWEGAGKLGKNGQRPISLSKLRLLDQNVKDAERLPLVRGEMAAAE
jgi:hypothetical protein